MVRAFRWKPSYSLHPPDIITYILQISTTLQSSDGDQFTKRIPAMQVTSFSQPCSLHPLGRNRVTIYSLPVYFRQGPRYNLDHVANSSMSEYCCLTFLVAVVAFRVGLPQWCTALQAVMTSLDDL